MKNIRCILKILPLAVIALTACNSKSSQLASITVQPTKLCMMSGTTQQFTAMGTYSDNTSRDITALVAWSSSDSTKASISNDSGQAGLVTANNGGSTDISASAYGVTASAKLSVISISMSLANIVFSQVATIRTDQVDQINTINYRIYTKSGNSAKDVNLSFSLSYLQANAWVDTAASTITIPVIGLYAAYDNKVAFTITLRDGATLNSLLTVHTGAYTSDQAVTGAVVTHKDENPNTSYFLIDTQDAPTIMDIDGEMRWQLGKQGAALGPVYINSDNFLIGDATGRRLYKINLFGGEISDTYTLADFRYVRWTHNFDTGKEGILGTMEYKVGSIDRIGSVLLEISQTEELLHTWDFDAIIGGAITAAGEDPSKFVQNNLDWFHINSAAYSARDDSLIVSSRENFIIKIDYSTGQIRWIMGNPAKMWFQNYPLSLQPYALKISGLMPIGQHSVSLVGTDEMPHQHILLMNNGAGNQALPYIGDNRNYSTVSLFEINETAMTATEVWSFDDNQQINSPACGSVYKTAVGNYLIDFATANNYEDAIVMSVDENKKLLFSMKIPKRPIDPSSCNLAYRIREIKLEKMQFR